MTDTLREKLKALEEDYLDIWEGGVEFKKGYKGYDGYLSDIDESIHQAVAEERERVVGEMRKGFGEFSLQDWSGEAEVYSEIDRLKNDLLSFLDKPLTDKESE